MKREVLCLMLKQMSLYNPLSTFLSSDFNLNHGGCENRTTDLLLNLLLRHALGDHVTPADGTFCFNQRDADGLDLASHKSADQLDV